eukprot:gnl/Spiro4/25395_TR12662_c0_g2_i2.p1 gnl/Spiro4/25395_TR12662_c0_g2~~gnl/Spiro4/25395_TR12662_c0_g2_i2.p1  ORF type:complete len:497 (-),score=104.96 gnl/Spiro4/25395_TR12662_c0_g2_i2:105-1595(-)
MARSRLVLAVLCLCVVCGFGTGPVCQTVPVLLAKGIKDAPVSKDAFAKELTVAVIAANMEGGDQSIGYVVREQEDDIVVVGFQELNAANHINQFDSIAQQLGENYVCAGQAVPSDCGTNCPALAVFVKKTIDAKAAWSYWFQAGSIFTYSKGYQLFALDISGSKTFLKVDEESVVSTPSKGEDESLVSTPSLKDVDESLISKPSPKVDQLEASKDDITVTNDDVVVLGSKVVSSKDDVVVLGAKDVTVEASKDESVLSATETTTTIVFGVVHAPVPSKYIGSPLPTVRGMMDLVSKLKPRAAFLFGDFNSRSGWGKKCAEKEKHSSLCCVTNSEVEALKQVAALTDGKFKPLKNTELPVPLADVIEPFLMADLLDPKKSFAEIRGDFGFLEADIHFPPTYKWEHKAATRFYKYSPPRPVEPSKDSYPDLEAYQNAVQFFRDWPQNCANTFDAMHMPSYPDHIVYTADQSVVKPVSYEAYETRSDHAALLLRATVSG